MKPAALDYIRADSLAEATALLAELGDDARILAGGQSLTPMLNMRLAAPRALVDIARVSELSGIRVDGALMVGAAVTQAKLEARATLASEAPLVALALPHIGHFQTRNRGTVGGSIAHADPSAELPLVLAALGGEVVLHSTQGSRRVAAAEFFTGMLTTACRPDELVAEIAFPLAREGARYGFREVALRHGDFALAAVAVAVARDGIRIAIGGVADCPFVESWPRLSGSALDDALDGLASRVGARDDDHASARYRRHLVRTLGRSLVEGLS